MAKRLILHDPKYHYYRVKLTETIGIGPGAVTMEGWIEHVWAEDDKIACAKAILFWMRKNPGTQPRLVAVERESYDKALQI